MVILSLAISVYALTIPHAFYGNAKYEDGSVVPDGTVITAKLNGEAVDTATVQDGKYGYGDDTLIVTDDNEQGGTITFYIDDVKAAEEVQFESAKISDLDLTFPGSAPAQETTQETSGSSGSSGGSSGGSGGSSGGSGGSSGGSSGSSTSSSSHDTTNVPVQQTTASDGNNDEDNADTGDLEFKSIPQNTDKDSKTTQEQDNSLTGAFTGVLSKTSGKLSLLAGLFLIVVLVLGVFHYRKKKKQP